VKWVIRGAVAVVVLMAFVLGGLFWALPRLAKSEVARDRIQEATRSVLGAELGYSDLDFGLLPPSLVMRDPSLLGDASTEPIARADRVALRVQLLPLLRRKLEVQSLAVDGLALHLVRDANGIALPQPTPGEKEMGDKAPESEPEVRPPPSEPTGIVLGIRTITLRDAMLTLEDRTASPPSTSSFEDIDIVFRAAGSGSARRLSGDVRIARSDLAMSGVSLRGPLNARLDLDDLRAASGVFEADASEAEIRYGADFAKPPGTPAVVRGTLARDSDGAIGADDLEIVLRNLVAKGSMRTGEAVTLQLAADPFELEGWEDLVPPLGLAKPRGRMSITELVVKPDLAGTHGRFTLDALELELPETGPLSFTGDVVLAGASLFARDAQLLLAGQPFVVSPKLDDLGGAPSFEVRFETTGASSDALLTAFADLPDRLHGPLGAEGTLRGPLFGAKPLSETLAGDVAFGIEKGRIVGASLLEAALGSLGKRVAESRQEQGSEAWERFYSEEFEQLTGKLHLEKGHLVTEPVTLGYRDYGVRLEGPIRLSDLELDLHGVLSLGPAVDAELARAFRASDDYVPQARELVLESVRGTPTKPKVQVSGNSVATLAAHYVKQTQREDLKRAVEKELGPGTGDVVERGLDALEGLLGGRR
jgi:hypothetical protein